MNSSAVLPEYCEGIRRAYRGELIGEWVYRILADRCPHIDQKNKLRAIAAVERLTAQRLQSIAERLGINPSAPDWQCAAKCRADDLGSLSWPAFLQRARLQWPPYIAKFAQLGQLAPSSDQNSIQLLVDHELALVRFVELKRRNPGTADSLGVLTAFLADKPILP